MPAELAVVFGVVFVVNLLPVFGPPTWAVLVFFNLKYELPLPLLVFFGALASAAGRFLLATAFRHLGYRLPEQRRLDLEAVGATLTERRGGRWGLLALFLVSPLPSTQLFEAAGLTPQIRLLPVTGAFFLGRLVTYSIYVVGSAAAAATLRSLFNEGFTSLWAILLQVGLLALLAAFVFTPWARILGYERAKPTG
ncbi:MAG: hypothetical protein F2813_00555 [Actinobacteria bacterium]|nr:hypothetical protein [Actinomycetota bacterium]